MSSSTTATKKTPKAVEKQSEKSDSKSSGKKTKSKEKGDRFDGGDAKSNKNVDILDDAAMENAYNICHNVQDLLQFRGFFWEGQKQKGAKKGRKKGKKGKG